MRGGRWEVGGGRWELGIGNWEAFFMHGSYEPPYTCIYEIEIQLTHIREIIVD